VPNRPRDAIGSRHDSPNASPGFLLWQVATLWQREIRAALEPLDLTHAQFVLLASTGWLEAHAADGEVVTQAAIAEHACTDAVMTSEVLRTLERKGLVQRGPHPTDARARRISLTAAGRFTVRRAVPLVEAVDETFFAQPGGPLRALAERLRG